MKFQNLTVEYRGKVNKEITNLKRIFMEAMGSQNFSIKNLLNQQDYYSAKTDKMKIYLDKAMTSVEWILMEKKRISGEVKKLKQEKVDNISYQETLKKLEKDIRLLKGRMVNKNRFINHSIIIIDSSGKRRQEDR